MREDKLIKLAREYCLHYHEGQVRKGSGKPFHTHPVAVSEILQKFGYDDVVTQCIALLHDVIEDTTLITGEIKDRFGYEIANGVYILSKNTIRDEALDSLNRGLPFDVKKLTDEQLYKIRMSFARRSVKRIKIADMIHNTEDLENLTPKSAKRKIDDANDFYIPMGKVIAPIMVKELERNIKEK